MSPAKQSLIKNKEYHNTESKCWNYEIIKGPKKIFRQVLEESKRCQNSHSPSQLWAERYSAKNKTHSVNRHNFKYKLRKEAKEA